jgi:hypothetical protein
MPKNIVATPAAVVAVDRLTLQADDARGDVLPAIGGCGVCTCTCACFSEE